MQENKASTGETLGRLTRPEAGQFQGKRKLYLVPLIFCGDQAPEEYVTKYQRYWQQTDEHLAKLEARMAPVRRIYHESVTATGEEGLKLLEKLHPDSYRIAHDRCQQGAALEITEDRGLSEESIDWERFLLMGFVSPTVARKVSELYLEASRRRYEYIARRIAETLGEDEAAILFIREGHMVQFPPDIAVFSVAPPALDEIHRWQRDRNQTEARGEPKGKEGPPGPLPSEDTAK